MSSEQMKTSGFDLHDRIIVTHAVFATLATLFTAPLAIISVRFLRPVYPKWLILHLGLQSFTILFVTITFALGTSAVMLGGHGSQFSGPKADRHHDLGLALFIIVYVQAGLGAASHYARGRTDAVLAEKSNLSPHLSAKRHPVRFAHAGFGLVIAVLLFAQFYLGLLEWNKASDNGTKVPRVIRIGFWVALGCTVAAYFGAQGFEHYMRRRTMQQVAAEDHGSSTEGEQLNATPVSQTQAV